MSVHHRELLQRLRGARSASDQSTCGDTRARGNAQETDIAKSCDPMRSAVARSTVLPKTNGLRAARGGSDRDQTEFVRLTTPSRAAQTELASARRGESRHQRVGDQLTARNLGDVKGTTCTFHGKH